MVKIRAKKPMRISNRDMSYDFSENLVQDIEDEEHIKILLSTNKFKIEK